MVVYALQLRRCDRHQAAILGTELELSDDQIYLGNSPGFAGVVNPRAFLGDKTLLLTVKIVLVKEAAEQAAAGAGNFH